MKKLALLMGFLVIIFLIGCNIGKKEYSTFTGQVNIKLIVKGTLSQSVADVLVYDSEDINVTRKNLAKELGPEAKITDNRFISNLPYLTLTKASAEDLKILEKSDLVEFFYSDEPMPVSSDPIDGMPMPEKPRFRWIYSREFGYQIGTTKNPNAKILNPESIYEIYSSNGRNIPKEIN